MNTLKQFKYTRIISQSYEVFFLIYVMAFLLCMFISYTKVETQILRKARALPVLVTILGFEPGPIRLSPHHDPNFPVPMTSTRRGRGGRPRRRTLPGRKLWVSLPRLVDVIGAENLGSWCGLSLIHSSTRVGKRIII